LGANGTAYTHGLNADYPLIRSLVYNLNFSANWDHKWYLNQANQSVTSKYQMQVGSWLLNGQALDNWLSGGVTTYSLAYTQGRVNLSDSPNELTDAQTVQTAGDFNKSNFNISRLQTLTPSLGLLLNFNAQRANKNLDSSEKIYLGGATGVRAYPSNEGGGSEGQTMSLELRQRIADVWTLSGFYDYGHVRIYPNNQDVLGAPLTGLNQFALRGAGLSVAWQAAPGVDFKLSVARRILDNPMANAKTGVDSDGTLRLNRVWFNAALAF
jgi:hemolysin activation/secretion protein